MDDGNEEWEFKMFTESYLMIEYYLLFFNTQTVELI